MALVNRTKKTDQIPHEDGCSFTYRPLKGKELRKAANVAMERAFEMAGKAAAASPGMAAQAQEARAARDASGGGKPAKAGPPTPDDYDIETVVGAGLLGITGPGYDADGKSTAFAAETDAGDLDPVTERVIFDAIMGVSKVPSS